MKFLKKTLIVLNVVALSMSPVFAMDRDKEGNDCSFYSKVCIVSELSPKIEVHLSGGVRVVPEDGVNLEEVLTEVGLSSEHGNSQEIFVHTLVMGSEDGLVGPGGTLNIGEESPKWNEYCRALANHSEALKNRVAITLLLDIRYNSERRSLEFTADNFQGTDNLFVYAGTAGGVLHPPFAKFSLGGQDIRVINFE